MAKQRKWEIRELEGVRKFRAAACVILENRLNTVLDSVNEFKSTGEVEALHDLRIAIRRLRYPLETLMACLDRKKALQFIQELNLLQDAAGTARDLDVLIERLHGDEGNFNWNLRRIVYIDLEEKRKQSYLHLKEAVDLFLVSPQLYDFKGEIQFQRRPEAPVNEPEIDDGQNREEAGAVN